MFDRLQKPFLTVETGEAYQPLRLVYDVYKKDELVALFNQAKCLEKTNSDSWNWYWRDECDDLHFESVDDFTRSSTIPIRIGSFLIKDNQLYLLLSSFKRACLAVPFLYRLMGVDVARIHHADFINKVFGPDERLPRGLSEIFKEEELEKILKQREEDYQKVQARCEHAATAEEATAILDEYMNAETQKRLPYAERYHFDWSESADADVLFLSFYIFLRGRELVAINRWFGQTNYVLSDVADDIVQQVFGGIDIDILE